LQFLRESKLQYNVDKIDRRRVKEGGQEGGGWELPIVGNLRLVEDEDTGREICYRIEIEKGQLPI
jgi:hypothetical protein